MPDGSQKKISELPVAPAAHPTDLLETSQADGTGYVSRSITLAQVAAGVVTPPPAWTDITGKPATFPPTVPIAWTDVSGKPTTFPPTLPIAYTDISGKPSTFPPDPEAIDDRVAALLVAGTNITLAYNDPANTLTINSTASGGAGTVTSVSVVNANGLAGTVATPTVTPAITLSTTVTGMLKGNGTAISAATAGTDYMTPGNVSAAYQPLDSGLTALSSIGTGMLANTAADTFAPRTITGTASRLSVTNGNGVAGNPTLDIAAAYDALWAPVSHTQTASTITDFSEAVDDRVAALLVAGTNITLAYNDPANTLTINSTGGGGGASVTVSDTAPGSPTSGALWWNSTLGVMFIWYTDPNTSQWVPVTPSGGVSPPNAIPQNAQTGNYTLVAQDAGQHIYHAVAAAAATYTIPANSSVPFVIGTTVTFVNDSANAITLAITTDTLIWSPGTTAGSRTLGTGGIATALKVTATRWILNGTALT